MNVYMTSDRAMHFEFALAGFNEKDINLSFQGDYMTFSATFSGEGGAHTDAHNADLPEKSETGYSSAESFADDEPVRYFKRSLKLKSIEKQKYFVPADKYDQESVKAVYKNGILKVLIPPKVEQERSDGIKITIVRDGV